MRVVAGLAGAAVLLLVSAPAVQAKIKAVACVPEWGALAEAIGGERLEVTVATMPLDNPEALTPTSAMIAALEGADMIVCTGAGLEDSWLPASVEKAGNPKIAAGKPGRFFAAEFVELRQDAAEEAAHASGGAGAHGATHVHGNPHIHGDPRNIQRVAAQLAKRLIALDPEGKDFYTDRTKAFLADLKARIADLQKMAAPLKKVRVAVQHENSLYLLDWLGIETGVTIEGPGGVAAGPARLANLMKSLPREQIKFVIYAAYEDPAAAKQIAQKAGVPLIKLPYTIGGTEEATDIFTFYEETIERLLDGLNGRERS